MSTKGPVLCHEAHRSPNSDLGPMPDLTTSAAGLTLPHHFSPIGPNPSHLSCGGKTLVASPGSPPITLLPANNPAWHSSLALDPLTASSPLALHPSSFLPGRKAPPSSSPQWLPSCPLLLHQQDLPLGESSAGTVLFTSDHLDQVRKEEKTTWPPLSQIQLCQQ